MEFAAELEGARTRLVQAVQRYRADAEGRLAGCAAGFEKWLDAEKRGSAGQRPKPGAVIDGLLDSKTATGLDLSVADVHLHKENERLKIELDRANSRLRSLLAPIEAQEPPRTPNSTPTDVGHTPNNENNNSLYLFKKDIKNLTMILGGIVGIVGIVGIFVVLKVALSAKTPW
jgi:hypothetical protein